MKKLFGIIFFLGIFSALHLPIAFAQDLPMQPPCSASAPVYPPDIYRVDTTRTSATVFSTVQKDTVTGYTVSYGLTEDASGAMQEILQQPENGAVIYTVNNLLLDATYYFRVRADNGCAHGPWSIVRVSNYPNSKTPRLPTTAGETNYIFWIGLAGIVCAMIGVGALVL